MFDYIRFYVYLNNDAKNTQLYRKYIVFMHKNNNNLKFVFGVIAMVL